MKISNLILIGVFFLNVPALAADSCDLGKLNSRQPSFKCTIDKTKDPFEGAVQKELGEMMKRVRKNLMMLWCKSGNVCNWFAGATGAGGGSANQQVDKLLKDYSLDGRGSGSSLVDIYLSMPRLKKTIEDKAGSSGAKMASACMSMPEMKEVFADLERSKALLAPWVGLYYGYTKAVPPPGSGIKPCIMDIEKSPRGLPMHNMLATGMGQRVMDRAMRTTKIRFSRDDPKTGDGCSKDEDTPLRMQTKYISEKGFSDVAIVK